MTTPPRSFCSPSGSSKNNEPGRAPNRGQAVSIDQGVKLQPFIKAGKQIQALSYLGHTGYGVREDAFFCYASARLAGFVWNGGRPLSDPETAILYQIRLGPPLGPEQEQNGVFYRLFDRGLVALNPDKTKPATLTLPESIPAAPTSGKSP